MFSHAIFHLSPYLDLRFKKEKIFDNLCLYGFFISYILQKCQCFKLNFKVVHVVLMKMYWTSRVVVNVSADVLFCIFKNPRQYSVHVITNVLSNTRNSHYLHFRLRFSYCFHPSCRGAQSLNLVLMTYIVHD